jgi:dephospho-CoA kinase
MYDVTKDLDALVEVADRLENLEEGFVVWDPKSGKRVKIKSKTYLIAHKLRGNDTVPTKKNLFMLVLEAALLIEEGYGEICDELWYIYASEEVRRKRLKSTRGYSDEKIDSIFASQLKEDEYRRHCREVIDNNGDIENTIASINKALSKYKE